MAFRVPLFKFDPYGPVLPDDCTGTQRTSIIEDLVETVVNHRSHLPVRSTPELLASWQSEVDGMDRWIRTHVPNPSEWIAQCAAIATNKNMVTWSAHRSDEFLLGWAPNQPEGALSWYLRRPHPTEDGFALDRSMRTDTLAQTVEALNLIFGDVKDPERWIKFYNLFPDRFMLLSRYVPQSAHQRFSQRLLKSVDKQYNVWAVCEFLDRTDLHPNDLKLFVDAPDHRVRCAVAANTGCPWEVASQTISQPDGRSYVIDCLLSRPDCPDDFVMWIISDSGYAKQVLNHSHLNPKLRVLAATL